MTDDARLTDFSPVAEGATRSVAHAEHRAGTDHTHDDRDGPPPAHDDRDGATPAREESAVSTYAWGEYTCSACGDATQRVWRADGELVCPACKSW